MKKIVLICLLLNGCRVGVRQEIIIENNSNNNIFYCLHSDTIPTLFDLRKTNPLSDREINIHFQNLRNYSVSDSIEIVESLRTQFLIKKQSKKTIISSRYLKIFKNSESIQDQIKFEYNGRLHISIVSEYYRNNFSDNEIIENNLYDHFLTIVENDIKENITVLKYKN